MSPPGWRRLSSALLVTAIFALAVAGCGGGKDSTLLESERQLAGMYEACRTIKLVDGGKELDPITLTEVKAGEKTEVDAVLVRSNGMRMPGRWAGPRLAPLLAERGVATPYKELRVEAWDGYVGRVEYEVAQRPDTLIAYLEDGKPLQRADGPMRLVIASQDGFYWVRMITKIEVVR